MSEGDPQSTPQILTLHFRATAFAFSSLTLVHSTQQQHHSRTFENIHRHQTMPELPEVEAARRAVEEHCLNKKIVKAVIANDTKVIDGVSPSDFESCLIGKSIVAARRKGKNMWLELDSPPFPTFQFGMAGAVYIKGVAVTKYKRSAVNDADEWPSKYSKFFIELDDGLELSFTDKRRFAKVRLLKDPTAVPPIAELGPDALFEPRTVEEFAESLSKKKTAIKPLLLDQSYISGIGNWIADEVLYQAKIHPQQIASSLTRDSCATLHRCIKEVIEKAVGVGADSIQFPESWIFHSREKKPGKAFVDGKKIDFITSGGRTTAYVPELQKLTGGQIAKAGGKSRETAKRKEREEQKEDESPSEDDGKEAKAKAKKNNPPRKRRAKKSEYDDDSSDVDADEKSSATESKKKQHKGQRKKPPAKTKTYDGNGSDGSDHAIDGDGEISIAKSKKGLNSNGQGKKPAAKRKSQEISNDFADSDSEEDGDSSVDEDQKKAEKATTRKKKSDVVSNKGKKTRNSRRSR